jgi:hypothetical protein
MADSTTDDLTLTDPEVTAAEAEAREAEALVRELENRVISGDSTVTPDQITAQESLSRFARLRVQFTTNKAAKAQDAARLQACEALAKEIQTASKPEGAELAKQLESVVQAFRGFSDAVEARNVRILEWRKRAEALGVPEHIHPVGAPAKHGRVGLTSNGGAYGLAGVIAGSLRVEQINRDVLLSRALDLLAREETFKHVPGVDAGNDLFGELAAIDTVIAEPVGPRFYYRGPGGGVFEKDKPFADDEIRRLSLTTISRHEAYGE